MIEAKTFYTLRCDHCDSWLAIEGYDYLVCVDEKEVREAAASDDWLQGEDGKWECYDCHLAATEGGAS